MTPDLLREAGEALYGAHWQSFLARDLGVAPRTMRRWAAGDSAPADGVISEVVRLVHARLRTLTVVNLRLTIAEAAVAKTAR